MRGMCRRLCCGRERKPLEPYGVMAPFLRAVACALAVVGALAALLALFAAQFAWWPVFTPAFVTALSAMGVAAVVRWAAGGSYPNPISLTVWNPDVRS